MAGNSGGSSGGLCVIVGALVVVVVVIAYFAFGSQLAHLGGMAPSKVELDVATPSSGG